MPLVDKVIGASGTKQWMKAQTAYRKEIKLFCDNCLKLEDKKEGKLPVGVKCRGIGREVRYCSRVCNITLAVYRVCPISRASVLVLILNVLCRNVSVQRGKGTNVNAVKTSVGSVVRLVFVTRTLTTHTRYKLYFRRRASH